jgi:DNA-binding response OmpR family regulator
MTETHHTTILVVDDAPDSLRFLTDTLEGEGYGVRIARDGHAALASLAAELPDLVLMDAVMPGIDGFETTRRIKADPALASVPVIFMTGLTETENVLDGLAAGGVDYVKKPIVLAELLARLKVHLGNARIAAGAFQQLPIEDNSTADSGGNHHGHEVVDATCATDPAFCKGQRFCITITKDR